jgi:hypothetical protein
MSEVQPVVVQLIGGCKDGDSIQILANGSLAPPALLGYINTGKDEGGVEHAVWDCYEAMGPRWDMFDVQEIKYHYVGQRKIMDVMNSPNR